MSQAGPAGHVSYECHWRETGHWNTPATQLQWSSTAAMAVRKLTSCNVARSPSPRAINDGSFPLRPTILSATPRFSAQGGPQGVPHLRAGAEPPPGLLQVSTASWLRVGHARQLTAPAESSKGLPTHRLCAGSLDRRGKCAHRTAAAFALTCPRLWQRRPGLV